MTWPEAFTVVGVTLALVWCFKMILQTDFSDGRPKIEPDPQYRSEVTTKTTAKESEDA